MSTPKLQWRLLQLERLLARLRKVWDIRRHSSKQVYVQDRVAEYRDMWRAVAEYIGASFALLTDDLWEMRLNGKKTRILNYKLQFDDPVTLETVGNKPLVYRLLSEKGLRVPEHEVFRLDELDRAESFLRRHPKGCVVKPANGTSSGVGVTTHILTRHEVRKAAVLASLYGSELLIEPMIPGESYRLLVLDREVIHAVHRRGRGHVIRHLAQLRLDLGPGLLQHKAPDQCCPNHGPGVLPVAVKDIGQHRGRALAGLAKPTPDLDGVWWFRRGLQRLLARIATVDNHLADIFHRYRQYTWAVIGAALIRRFVLRQTWKQIQTELSQMPADVAPAPSVDSIRRWCQAYAGYAQAWLKAALAVLATVWPQLAQLNAHGVQVTSPPQQLLQATAALVSWLAPARGASATTTVADLRAVWRWGWNQDVGRLT